MANLPDKPWSEGDTFTNDNTGVEYTFDGVKWLASGGEELDLSAFVTDAELAQVNEASEFRDDALNVKIEDESTQNTAAHAVFTAGLADHEDRITELEKAPDPAPQPDEAKLEGALRWVDYTYSSDTIDALVKTIRVHTDRTKMSLNWDTIDDGRKDWAELIDGSVGLEVDGNIYWAMVEYVGEAGTSGRGKNFKILDHNIPPAGEIAADSITGIWPNYEPSVSYATTEYVDAGDQALQAQIDAIEIPEAAEPAKQMFSTSVFGAASNSTNLSNGDWHFIISNGQPTVVGDNAEGLVYKVNTRDWWKDKCELTGFGYVVVSSKDGFVYWGGHVKDGEFNEKGELVLDLPRSQRQTSGGTATLGTTCRIDFYNVFREL